MMADFKDVATQRIPLGFHTGISWITITMPVHACTGPVQGQTKVCRRDLRGAIDPSKNLATMPICGKCPYVANTLEFRPHSISKYF